jgi:cation diffusion facilitator family transporter
MPAGSGQLDGGIAKVGHDRPGWVDRTADRDAARGGFESEGKTDVTDNRRGIRAAQVGLLVNGVLVIVKLLAGIVGHSYALIADAVESSTDLFSSLIVWGGLWISARPADDDHPYGHGKAEPIATAVVALMLLGAALGIATAAIHEILTPHHTPAAFTLVVLALVVLVKEVLFRRVLAVGLQVGSLVVRADAWHHRSDALTSLAAFVGILIAVVGGPGWEPADDWAALVAAGVIAFNGIGLLREAIHDLMDRAPALELIDRIDVAARSVEGVLATEKLRVRKFGSRYFVDLHVQADPALSLHAAHILSGKVKGAIREAIPAVSDASIHMEPHEPASGGAADV